MFIGPFPDMKPYAGSHNRYKPATDPGEPG
jgi:hypothetical protein